jgi:hypothetical protein
LHFVPRATSEGFGVGPALRAAQSRPWSSARQGPYDGAMDTLLPNAR